VLHSVAFTQLQPLEYTRGGATCIRI